MGSSTTSGPRSPSCSGPSLFHSSTRGRSAPHIMANEVRLQSLRDCAVRIRNRHTQAILGTGIIVSMDGKIVTCGHVVVAAGVNPRTGSAIPGVWTALVKAIFEKDPTPDDDEVGICF